MKQLLAFHGDPKVKKKYVSRIRAHRKADQLIKGQYWEDGKGCAVGCTLHSANHAAYETELGIPQILAQLEDRIFENLPLAQALIWPERFLRAAKVGANLSDIWDKWALWVLSDTEYGVLQAAKTEKTKKVIEGVINLYTRRVAGREPNRMEWGEAYKIAASATDAAAYAATSATATDAAYASAFAASATDAAAAAYAATSATATDAAYASAFAASAASAASATDASATDAAAYASAAYAAASATDASAYAATSVTDAAAAYAAASATDAAAREKFFVAASEKLLKLMRKAK